jgi:hypothetical protein
MKTIYKIFSILLLFAVFSLSFSCGKVDLGNLEEYDVSFKEVESVMKTESMLNIAFIDIFNIGIRAGAFYDETSAMGKKDVVPNSDIMGGTMTIRQIEGSAPFSLVIADWTDVNREDNYGFLRRGGLVAKVNSPWNEKGSKIEITFGISENVANSIGETSRDAYYFNDYKIQGEVVLENLGNGKYHFVILDGVITSPNGKVAKRNSDLFLQWEEGTETPKDINDDVWHIYGTVDGVTSNNMDYSITVDEDKYLLKSICTFPLKGVADFMIKKMKFALDYAPVDEGCDNIAEVDFYGAKKIIEFGE